MSVNIQHPHHSRRTGEKTSYTAMSFSDRVAELAIERDIALGDGAIANIAMLENHWSEVEFELKFEITERCDLNCSFCHQEFGKKIQAR